MYLPGQIIYDRIAKKPVQILDIWNPEDYPKRNTHFLKSQPKKGQWTEELVIALPETVEEAEELLEKGLITPAPVSSSHCWKCGNWLSNHNKDGSCWR